MSAIPIPGDGNPLSIDDMELVKRIMTELCGQRAGARAGADVPEHRRRRARSGTRWRRCARSTRSSPGRCTRTPAGRRGGSTTTTRSITKGGKAFIENVRAVGPKIIAVHKGFGLVGGEQPRVRVAGRRRTGGQGESRRQVRDLPLRLRARGPGRALQRRDRRRRRQQLDQDRDGERHRQGRQRLRRAGVDVAVGHERPDSGRARARQAAEAVRSRQRRLGHGLDLVRLTPGPDPGVPGRSRSRPSSRSSSATRR